MCLGDAAHGVDREHEIFQGPFPVKLQWESESVPPHYRNFYTGRDLPEDGMEVWRVQTISYTRPQDDTSPGVVAGGWGWEDSPDAEYIAGGLNTKGPNATALGRHGPLFHWGFYAEPRDMTPSGRAAFLNAVAYTAKFDRQPLLVRKVARARGYALDAAMRLARLEESWQERLAMIEDINGRIAQAKARLEAGEELQGMDASYAELPPQEPPTWEEFRDEAFTYAAPAALVAELGRDDPAAYLRYYEQNRGYLMPDPENPRAFVVDEDARAYGMANHELALLDAAIADFNAQDVERSARARRLLERYTGLTLPTAEAWSAWLQEARPRLFFSDVGGYRWFVAPEDTQVREAAAPVGAAEVGEF